MHAEDRPRKPSDARPGRDTLPRTATSGAAVLDSRFQGMSPQRVLALQRSIGNAAASSMVEESRHQHGSGCGHTQTPTDAATAPVQRSAVHDVLRSGGRPLDDSTRTEMEGRLGASFSDVRIHNDGAARASAAEVGARAYTSGSHVVIGDGGADKHTLAHELTHVIQQRQGPVAGTDNGTGLQVSNPSDRFEQAAEANAHRVMSGPAPVQRTGAEQLPGAGTPTTLDAPVQRMALVGTVVGEIREASKIPAAWNVTGPEFFTYPQKKLKEIFGTPRPSADKLLAYQQEMWGHLTEMLESDETFRATGKDELKAAVAKYRSDKQKAATRPDGVGERVAPGEMSQKVQALHDDLIASGRAFPLSEITKLANKADEPGSGFYYELNLGKEALDNDPHCKVQFGSMTRDHIPTFLGGKLSDHVQETRRGPTGADVVVWTPKKSEGAIAVPIEYAADFIQAKSTTFDNIHDNIKAARNQLEGNNASGHGENADQREITLRGPGYSGTICLDISGGVSDFGKLKREAEGALTSKFVDRVLAWDAVGGHMHEFRK